MGRDALGQWEDLYRFVNGLPEIGVPGVRDTAYPCEDFDGKGFDGTGRCDSDGHYLCVECSHLSSEAPRFVEYGDDGERYRERLLARLETGGRDGQ